MKPPPHIQAILDLWQRLTGQTWRVLPYSVMQEAQVFHDAGFTPEETQLVIAYTEREIARNSSGFNGQSKTWGVLAADNWNKFQQRLTSAREADKRKPLPKAQVATTIRISDTQTQTSMRDKEAPEPARIDVAAAFRSMAEHIARQ